MEHWDFIFELDNELSGLKSAYEKAKIMCDDLNGDYFGEPEPEEWFLRAYYGASAVKTNIIGDYLIEMDRYIEKLKELIKQQFEIKKQHNV